MMRVRRAKHKLEGKPKDLSYSRNSLLRVDSDTIEGIPNDRRADTRLKVLEDKEEEGIGPRVSLRAIISGGAPPKKRSTYLRGARQYENGNPPLMCT